jgi:quercetin dioxygenase-like cupin family protein
MLPIRRWSGTHAPTENEIQTLFDAEGLQAYTWSNAPGDVYAAHAHSYHKVIYVAQGSIEFDFPDEHERVTLNAGDRVEIEPGLKHSAVVGANGVACLEAHR